MRILNDIIGFFGSETWAPVGNFFTLIGVVSTTFAFARFFYNCKKKEWGGNKP